MTGCFNACLCSSAEISCDNNSVPFNFVPTQLCEYLQRFCDVWVETGDLSGEGEKFATDDFQTLRWGSTVFDPFCEPDDWIGTISVDS